MQPMFGETDENFLQELLQRTYSNGGEYADLYLEKSRYTSIIIEDGKVDKIRMGCDGGVGLRLIYNGVTSYASSNDPSVWTDLADSLQKIAAESSEKKYLTTFGRRMPEVSFPIKIMPEKITLKEKLNDLLKAEKAAWSVSDKIKQVKIQYEEIIKDVQILTSDQVITRERRIYTVAIVHVIAVDGFIIQTGYDTAGGLLGYELFDEHPVELMAEMAARKALMMLTAQPAPSGRMSVVLSSEAGGTMVHEAVGHGLEADLALSGNSIYANKKGEIVASPMVTVIDDATLPNKRGSYQFDDEGNPSKRTVLIENGILKSYMYDREHAVKDNIEPTGNGRRESYRFTPIPRMSNTFIAPGNHTSDDIVRSLSKGILVKKMGGGQVNTVTGDFVFEINEGYLVENGEVGEPIRGASLTGNGPEVLKGISMVGRDLGFSIGTCGKDGQGVPVSDAQPTIKVEELIIGGTGPKG